MRVMLTGASGFLGAHVACALLARGTHPTAVLRPGGTPWRLAELRGRLDVVEADLCDPRAAERVVRDTAPDIVCDLAWHGVGNRFHDDPVQVDANLDPHLALLRAAARGGCRRWIGLGSQAEYGPQEARIDEACLPRPTTLYGAVKLSLGLIGRRIAAQAGMEFVWLRLFSSYGPMDSPGWLIPQVTLALLRGERPKLTAGTQRWDYLYVEDAAEAITAAVFAPRLDGVYNLASGRAVPVRDIVQTIRDLIDPKLALGFGEIPFKPNQIMLLEADITQLCGALSWRPTTALGDGLGRTVSWYRAHPEPPHAA